MSEQRKPIFGFLWPSADPDAPVDGAYRQQRRVRITPRGPIRVLLLVAGTLLVAVGAGSAVMAGLSSGSILGSFAAAAVIGLLLVLVLRGWVVGTYVTDAAVTIERTFSRLTIPWTAVTAVEIVDTGNGRHAELVLDDGTREPTHVSTRSLDLWLRPEAFDIAALRLQRWLPES